MRERRREGRSKNGLDKCQRKEEGGRKEGKEGVHEGGGIGGKVCKVSRLDSQHS